MLSAMLMNDLRISSKNRTNLTVFILYVFILSAITFGLHWFSNTSKSPINPDYGSKILLVLFLFISLAVYSISSTFTVYIMSSEKNNISFIKPTLLRNHQILFSKIIVISAYILVLIFLSFPIMVLITPIFGFSLKNLFECYLITFISALAFNIMGILFSSFLNRMNALSLTYIFAGFLSIGTILVPLTMTKILKVKLSSNVVNTLYGLSPFWILSKKISETNLSDKIFIIPLWLYPILTYFLILAVAISLAFVFVRRW